MSRKPWDTGTLKGLAEMAIDLRHTFYEDRECPIDLWKFHDIFVSLPQGRDYVQNFEGSRAEFKDEIQQMHAVFRWVDWGMPVFDLTHGLMAALLLTDPSDVASEEVKPPFDTFIVRFPDGFWHKQTGDRETSVNLGTVHILETYTSSSEHVAQPMISMRLMGRDQSSLWETIETPEKGGKISEWLKRAAPSVNEGRNVAPPDEHDHRLFTAFRRLYINLCLYVAQNGRGERPGGPRTIVRRKFLGESRETSPEIWVLGREVKLDRNLMEAAKAWTDSNSPVAAAREGWKLSSQFTVRGHWRNQAHGPGRSLRKMKWIAPFWKGEGPTFQHVYKPGR